MGALSPHSDRYIALLRLRSERRVILLMGVTMSFFALLWAVWGISHSTPKVAVIPAVYVLCAALSLGGLWHPRSERTARHTLLLAGIVLPFLFQLNMGGTMRSGLLMLWCLPSLVAAVNVNRGWVRYGYLVLTGGLLIGFALVDPVLSTPPQLAALPPTLLLAFNLGTTMPVNFLLADRMLASQRSLRRKVFTIQREAEQRMMADLQTRNLEIQQSLDHAGRVQRSLWPQRERLRDLFSDMHVIYHSKEAVGGDMVWHARVEDRSYFIVLDCTGHGVPGGLMSVLMHGLLNEVVHGNKGLTATQVVRRTQQLLNDRLDRDRTGTTDGAEMAVLCFDHSARKLSCCNLGCGIVVQHGGISTHLRSHAGSSSLLSESRLNELDEFVVTVTEDTRLFLYTDGIADQFCARDQRKFSRNRLERTLMEAAFRSPSEQMEHFTAAFDDWRGDTPLVDDALLVALVPQPCWRSICEEDEERAA